MVTEALRLHPFHQHKISNLNVCSLAVNDRGQAEDCNLSPNSMQSNRCSLLCVNIRQYRAKNRGNCGIAVLNSTAKPTVLVP